MSRTKARVLLVLASVIVSLGVAEMVVRATGRAPSFGAARGGQHAPSPDPELIWVNTRGSLDHNQLGLRGDDIEAKRRTRVLLLGDSVAYGFGLAIEDSITVLTEALLARLGHDIEVVNAGTCGYNTVQEARWLETRRAEFDPDLTVVLYCLNDPLPSLGPDERMIRDARKHGNEGDWEAARGIQQMSSTSRFLMTHFHLVRLLLALKTLEPMQAVTTRRPDALMGDDLGLVELGLRRIADVCHADGRKPSLVVAPWIQAVEKNYKYAEHHAAVDKLAAECGFEVLDLLPTFVAARAQGADPLHLPGDPVHPNQKGARLIARTLAEHILHRLDE